LAAIAIYAAYRFRSWGFDWALFVSSLQNIQPVWLAASVLATMLTYVARGFRWQVLLAPLKPVPMGPLIRTNLLGFSAIYLLGRPGELVRPLWLARREGIPLTASIATIIVERVLDSLMLIVVFGVSLLLVKTASSAQQTLLMMKQTSWFMLAGSAAGLLFLVFFRSNIEKIVRFVPFARLGHLLRTFSEGLSFLDRTKNLGLAIGHTGLVWAVIVLQFWFMLLGMNFPFSIWEAALVMVGAAIGSVAQVPGIGGGFQAGYVFCLTTFFAIPPEQALATSLIAWVSSYLPTVMAGGFYMLSQGLSLKDLRAATAE
jgi:uncharacterized protein (TIRG00374 family)